MMFLFKKSYIKNSHEKSHKINSHENFPYFLSGKINKIRKL